MKKNRAILITLCLLILSQSGAYAHIKYHYPIIFVHGLISSENEFSETMLYLRVNQDFGDINIFDIVLNADDNSESALMSEDVKWEDFTYNEDEINIGRRNYAASPDDFVDGWTGQNLFAINFKEERIRGAAGTLNDYFDQSNEAAIFKQGYALNKMIAEVLDYTGAEKVILVGHSMGGLAIREYLQRTDEQGTHTNWIDPYSPDGHKVARVFTFGTPHLGANTSPDPTKSNIPNLTGNSEANRDMLWKYNSYTFCDDDTTQGIYMFGGYEHCIQSEDGIFGNSTFDNVDINCDGDEDDYITGINEGLFSTSYNPDMPLPQNIRYTWLTSIWIGWDIGLIGDGAVNIERQLLYVADQPVPAGLTDTCMSDVFHSSEGNDYFTILRGLDEPQQFHLAYKSMLGDTISGHITFQQNYEVIDRDMYLIPANGENAINIYVENNNLLDSIHIYDKFQNPILQYAAENIPDRYEDCHLGGTSNFIHHYNHMTSNIHTQSPGGNPLCSGKFRVNHVSNYNSWHTYGIEWSPSKLIWYVDGFPVRNTPNPGITAETKLIFNVALNPGVTPYNSSDFPDKMYIDFVKVYDLDNDCKTNMNICNYNFLNHNNKVKKNITIGNGTCNNSLNTNDNVYLRASEGVLINGNFTVPVAAKLYIDVNPCY